MKNTASRSVIKLFQDIDNPDALVLSVFKDGVRDFQINIEHVRVPKTANILKTQRFYTLLWLFLDHRRSTFPIRRDVF